LLACCPSKFSKVLAIVGVSACFMCDDGWIAWGCEVWGNPIWPSPLMPRNRSHNPQAWKHVLTYNEESVSPIPYLWWWACVVAQYLNCMLIKLPHCMHLVVSQAWSQLCIFVPSLVRICVHHIENSIIQNDLHDAFHSRYIVFLSVGSKAHRGGVEYGTSFQFLRNEETLAY
jgi:hypothetical protein